MTLDAVHALVDIHPGQVTLSDRRTRSTWVVDLAPYSIARFPVTQECYADVVGDWPSAGQGSRLPVENVSWWEAVRFCNALSQREGLVPAYSWGSDNGVDQADGTGPPDGVDQAGGDRPEGIAQPDGIEWDVSADGYRLPTEGEWEYACRAGSTGPRYGPLDEIAWYRRNSDEQIHGVGGKVPNAWGLFDTLGNVWEWCWDIYDAEVYGTYRVLRGGGWFDEHWSCRASVRRRSHPSLRIDDVGFRVVRSVFA